MTDPPPKVHVYKDGRWWWWEHPCRYRGGAMNYSYPQESQPEALASAMKHLENCW